MNFWSLFSRGLTRKQGRQTSQGASDYTNTAAVVTFDTAMQVSAFWASVKLLSETVGAMPIESFVTDNGSKTKDADYDLWKLINYKPNRYQTRNEFFESVMLNLVTDGNAYCAIERGSMGIVSLLPLMSRQMQVDLSPDGDVIYTYQDSQHNTRIYSEQSILHIKLFGNGLMGLSPLSHAAKSLGVAIALEDRTSVLAKNGGNPSGLLMIDQMLKPEQRDAIEKQLNKKASNGGSLFVLEAGMTYQQTSINPNDQQLLQSRRFEIEDIARFMGVPSILINDTSATTTWGSGISEINQGFYKFNLKPYLERIESAIKKKLMPEKDWYNRDIEFNFDSLLRADKKTRADTMSAEVNAGILTPNEARAMEGRPAQEGGDEIYLNGSLQPAKNLAESDNGTETFTN